MAETFDVRSVDEANAVMAAVVNQTVREATRLSFQLVLRQQILPQLQKWHAEYFRRDAGPSGESWPPLRPFTVQKKGHSEILEDTLQLLRSLVSKNRSSIAEVRREGRADVLRYGTNRAHAWRHQLGIGNNLPQREFLGLDNTKVDRIADMLANDAVRQLKRVWPQPVRAAS